MTPTRWLPLIPFALLLAGCSSKSSVSGKVTYLGDAVTGGSVTLVVADGTVHSGIIGSDGTFSIPDVPAGKVKIGVVGPKDGTKVPPAGRGGEQGEAPAPAPVAGKAIPPQYANPETSELMGTVKPGEPLNIDLK